MADLKDDGGKRNDVFVCDVPKLVAACCVLHNIIM